MPFFVVTVSVTLPLTLTSSFTTNLRFNIGVPRTSTSHTFIDLAPLASESLRIALLKFEGNLPLPFVCSGAKTPSFLLSKAIPLVSVVL